MQKRKMKSSTSSNFYFTEDTEKSIIEYCNTEDHVKRSKIYEDKLEYPFYKLCEILIHKYKFYYINDNLEDTKSETINHILDKLYNYKRLNGKAFSYFHIVARNFLITKNREAYKKLKESEDIDNIEVIDHTDSREDAYKFLDIFTKYLDYNLETLFTKQMDKAIAGAINTILIRRDNIYNLNKKALFILIKEMTNAKAQQITKIINIYKKLYKNANDYYLKYDELPFNKNFKGVCLNDRIR